MIELYLPVRWPCLGLTFLAAVQHRAAAGALLQLDSRLVRIRLAPITDSGERRLCGYGVLERIALHGGPKDGGRRYTMTWSDSEHIAEGRGQHVFPSRAVSHLRPQAAG